MAVYYKQLDGVRFMAIFMVAIAHYVQWQVENPIAVNIPFVYGVTLFFVLSGFLITRILLQQSENSIGKSLKVFYMRRALRIFPLYYLVLIIVFAIGYVSYRDLIPWLSSYTINFYHTLNMGRSLGDFSHLWSLAVEEQFYLVWPLVVFFVKRAHFLKVALGLAAGSLIYKTVMLVVIGNWIEADTGFLSNFYALGLGGVLGYLSLYKKSVYSVLGGNTLFLSTLLLSALSVGYRIYFPEDIIFKVVIMQLVWVLFFGSLIVKASFNTSGILQTVFENRMVSYLGKISYGIYIIHLFIPTLFYNLDPNSIFIQNKYVGFIGFFSVTVLLASVSWHLFEKPILKIKKHFEY